MALNIKILCSSPSHPVVPWLNRWTESCNKKNKVSLVFSKVDLESGDLLFLISCTEIIEQEIRERFKHTAVVHASDLPKGRGWSPYIWAILAGADEIVISALEAENAVDSGAIWAKKRVAIPKHALSDEINEQLFDATIDLMSRVCQMIKGGLKPQPQDPHLPTYWPRRTPADSEINPNASITSQFDAIRVSDPDRYPAFFRLRGQEFEIRLTRRQKAR